MQQKFSIGKVYKGRVLIVEFLISQLSFSETAGCLADAAPAAREICSG
jgi:hypothetical protein